tara:strand:+ start:4249 stop:4533 length:285 start_codon:yes stop_codon:yes gene_type:complete
MKNKKQLLNKENWVQYLELAQDGELTINAMANDIVAKISQGLNTHDEEELWCVKQYLTDRDVPTEKNGKNLSMVGRIMAYQKMTHDDAYTQSLE